MINYSSSCGSEQSDRKEEKEVESEGKEGSKPLVEGFGSPGEERLAMHTMPSSAVLLDVRVAGGVRVRDTQERNESL